MTPEDAEESDSLNQLVKDLQRAAALDDTADLSLVDEHGVISVPNGPQSTDRTAYSTSMSCTQAFDQILKCYSLGGLVRDYYRYGTAANCGEKIEKWKFCIKSKMMSNREEAVRGYYITQAAKRAQHNNSSESVWRSRATAVVDPFREDSAQLLQETEEKQHSK